MKQGDVLAWLKRKGTRRNVEGMARYGIVAERVFGVGVAPLRGLAKRIGTDHALAKALWKSGWYEARMLATMVADPMRLTKRQMNAWAADFDNWAICDTACFVLFDRTPHAWERARAWSRSPREFVKRAGFALMASLAGHARTAPDAKFLAFLPLIEKGAADGRNFVKKGVSWALRRIGHRSRALHAAAVSAARRLAASDVPSCRWVGKDTLRDLERPAVRAKVARSRGSGAR
jgi:3-methyladenine DNA glycosylase AlkD